MDYQWIITGFSGLSEEFNGLSMDYHWIPVMYSIHCVYKRLFGGVSLGDPLFIGLGGGFLGNYWSRRWISRDLLVSEVDFSGKLGQRWCKMGQTEGF